MLSTINVCAIKGVIDQNFSFHYRVAEIRLSESRRLATWVSLHFPVTDLLLIRVLYVFVPEDCEVSRMPGSTISVKLANVCAAAE